MFIKKEELNEIKFKLRKLEEEQEKLQDTIKFLGQHNRDEIVANTKSFDDCERIFFYDTFEKGKIEYIDNFGEYQIQAIQLRKSMKIEDIEKVDNDIYVLHFKDTTKDESFKCDDKFLQLNKSTNEILDITDIKARYENQEKVSAHLKESTQALSEVVKDFFKAKDTHQKLNEKTTTAKKTKKTTKK